MKPSETAAGQAWLGNFEGADVAAATILLDSLRFVSLSRLRQGLYSRLGELAQGESLRTPAVVFPERSMADFGIPENRRGSAVAYVDFDPGAPVAAASGSEAFVATVLRDLPGVKNSAREKDAPWMAPDADPEEMRKRRCRSLVIVTDYMGTGSQVLDFVRALGRNRTIRSWMSFKWTQIHVVAFASSPAAIERVREDRDVASVSTVEAAPTFATETWEPEVRTAIADLCCSKCGISAHWALGFHESGGLFLTERGAPNNLPAILWQDPPGWTPLFGSRVVPAEFARQMGDYRRDKPLDELAERLGQLRLGRNQRLGNMRKSSTSLLKVLLLLNSGRRDVATLAAELGGLDIDDVEPLVRCLERLGWVDDTREITDLGREEIAANKRGLRRTTAGLAGTDDPYYPHALR